MSLPLGFVPPASIADMSEPCRHFAFVPIVFSNSGFRCGDLTTAIVPAGTSFPAVLREPCDLVCSLRGNLLLRPVELGSVDPHAMQNDRELARDGDFGLTEPISLGEPHPPSLYRPPFRHTGHHHPACFEKITPYHGFPT